ncbi:MAG: hypothetical protein H6935_06600 [Thiobacillus sp.]|nr:hypothetical protein [Thiobacillus sp.]
MNAKKSFLILVAGLSSLIGTPAWALTLSQQPLFIASTQPRIMLLLSRDHELSRKAYTDYSDLDNDGTLDTTYNDAVDYYGYFDAKRCYVYDGGDGRFEPSAAAAGANLHECAGEWSGNFLNWATMTRLDVVRKVLYGGFRSTDGTGTAIGTTVLERSFLPPDVHAFAKVFAPAGGAVDVAKFTPYAQAAITLCNVSDMGNNVQAGNISTVNGANTSPAPLIKVAGGAWPTWAMTEILQCQWDEQTVEPSPRPSTAAHRLTGASDLIARVTVCVPGMLEENCKSYYDNANPRVETVKPTGLLQEYGDVDADRRVRFGLMTGSYKKNTSGGVLRKNVKLLANNNNTSLTAAAVCGDNNAADEIDVCTGQFINQASADTGIIDTLNRIHISGYKTPAAGAITANQVCSSGYNNAAPFACNASNLLAGTNGTCIDWGNPLSEMYHEAMRYFAGKISATAAYAVDDGAATSVVAGLGQDTWNAASDPLPATEWCALSNIIVLSTGLTSLDNASIVSDIAGLDPTALTNAVGVAEGLAGNYLIGSNGVVTNNLCSAKALNNLSSASGICPELPHMKGGYLIAGLASANRSIDLRPGYAANRAARWDGINQNWVDRQPLGTYTVGLAENLPSFELTVGAGKVSIVPSCRSNGATICSMTDLRVESYTATSGSFLVSWEDNSAGSDYDMDTIARIQYCVGGACAVPAAADEVKITVSAAQSATGSGMELGYTVSGSSQDGTYFPIKIPGTATCNPNDCPAGGNANRNFFSHLTAPAAFRCVDFNTAGPAASYTCPDGTRMPSGIVSAVGCPASQAGGAGANCGCPKTWTFTQSAAPAGLLKNPLWYAAKYGAPAASWDLVDNDTGAAGADGEPDNFFEVRNPAKLSTALGEVFDRASEPDASAASVATNSTNLKIESRVYQAKFSSADWSGQLLSYKISTAGDLSAMAEWDAGVKVNAQNYLNGRAIITKGATGDGVAFAYNNLTGPTGVAGTQKNLLDKVTVGANTVVDGCGPERVAYLRGDATNEGDAGSFNCASGNSAAVFRERATSKLGDIVNSNPWYVGKPTAGYSNVDHPGYSTFRTNNLNRTAMVYVAGNDGMLHGFDASVQWDATVDVDGDGNADGDYVPTANSGKEVIAYVPTPVYANLSSLTHSTYNKNHKYFVDGSPMIGDADLDSGAANDWRSVLVGALGAGGKGYYALDVTNPANFSEANAATLFLWEFTDSDDADMGNAFNHPPAHFSTGQPRQLVKMANGKWAVVLGNGYNSTNGNAALYIVFIEEGLDGVWTAGTDYIKIVSDNTGNNGLSTPVPFDMDGNGVVDVVYAGDLKGNLWKFLVGDANPANWRVDFSAAACAPNCNPLFQAEHGGTAQAIIWPPEVSVHPSATGALVLFGTGKYLEGTDVSNTDVQAYYGVWDKNDGATKVAVADLVQRHISTDTIQYDSDGDGVNDGQVDVRISCDAANRTIANCQKPAVNWAADMGWYVDLPTAGERATGITKLLNGVLYVNTFIPSSSPCDAGGTGWLMALDYASGETPAFAVFDVDNDGDIDADDAPIVGLQVGAALGGTTLIQGANIDSLGVGVSSLTSGVMQTNLINFGAGVRGRVNWREIVQ